MVDDLLLLFAWNLGQIDWTRTGPIGVEPTLLHMAMKTRPRPIAWTLGVSVLDRIHVDVIAISVAR